MARTSEPTYSLIARYLRKQVLRGEYSDGCAPQVGTVDDLMGLADDTVMDVVSPPKRKVDLTSARRLRLD
jgi:hypothetical protein